MPGFLKAKRIRSINASDPFFHAFLDEDEDEGEDEDEDNALRGISI